MHFFRKRVHCALKIQPTNIYFDFDRQNRYIFILYTEGNNF